MRLLVLAGGFGTRLAPVLGECPKALAPINQVPFLKYQINCWVHQGITHLTFLLHYRSDQVIEFLKAEQNQHGSKIYIDWITEPEPLGTGGAILNAILKLNIADRFFVANADTWLSSGLEAFATGSPQLLGVVWQEKVGRYGQVVFDDEHIIRDFVEKSGKNTAGWINAGVSLLTPDIFLNFKNLIQFSLEDDVFLDAVSKSTLRVKILESQFIDIGVPDDYYKFISWVNKQGLEHSCTPL